MAQHDTSETTDPAGIGRETTLPPSVFEERYGTGSRALLITLLEQPCVTFAAIAGRFGVSRERVRQWHRALLPSAPAGHARQRLCARHQQRRRLFQDPLFRTFFRHARAHFSAGVVQPIHARHGYRTREVLIDGRVVALRDASARQQETSTSRFRYRGSAAYLYVYLGPDAFLFAPAAAVQPGESSAAETTARLDRFKNTFAAMHDLI